MIQFLLILFWATVAVIVFTYILFPAIVFVRGRLVRKPYKSAEITPPITMVIAAHNEAANIGAKLDNILAMDYPREQLEVIIASDGSNDGTNEIVQGYAARNVRLLALPRQGKAPALDAAVAHARGDVLVFSDANSMYHPQALRALARPFADPEVGGVAGNQVYTSKKSESLSGDGEQSYWSFDRKMKQSQSKSGNAISATGAIYAIRRALFRGVPVGVTDDFAVSTDVIAQGYRLVFAPDAIAYEPVAGTGSVEFGRKVRVITRGLRGVLVVRRELLNPMRYGFYAFQLFAHKVLRRLVVFPLLLLLILSPLLWSAGLIYQLATLAQLAFYGCALLGLLLKDKRLGRLKLFTIPFFFCMVNVASLIAAINLIRGHRIDFWEPQRQGQAAAADQNQQNVVSDRGRAISQ
ncbi:MAG TPA: glycosyltransferase family 2 protein [Kouleothrix sp.]|uniref:glycosyltransferase family 2 protein n=1 Tax=Kouleothrix sp. TaxID=2779161 RepID=UPI002BDAD282|nr:glycosyltransferase family 2 protein [Kouleothrix sp.]